MSRNEWGYVVDGEGNEIPLDPPQFSIPEEEREYVYKSPGLTLWTQREEK